MKRTLSKTSGISTVVGTLIFLILMFAVFGAILAAFQFQSDLIGFQYKISDSNIKKAQEVFSINPSITGGNLHVDVINSGANAIEIVDVWKVEKGEQENAIRIPIVQENAFVPSGSTIDVMKSPQPTESASSTSTYTIKAVTALGNVATNSFDPTQPGPSPPPVVNTLLAKPSVLSSFANPIFDGKDPIITLVVANPTGFQMAVYQVALQIVNPNNAAVFANTGQDVVPCGTAVSHIEPIGEQYDDWDCSGETVIWSRTNTDVIVDKRSAKVFSVKINGINTKVKNAPINLVTTSTFTSIGQFGNIKSDTLATYNTNGIYEPMPYIYQSTGPAVYDRVYLIDPVTEGASKEYYFTIENLGTGTINTDTYLIINLPRGFTEPSYPSPQTGFNINNIQKQKIEEQWHLKVPFSTTLSPPEKRTFQFTTTAPNDISQETLYVFYAFASGTATCNGCEPYVIGPVSETVVRAIPQ